MGLKAVSSAGGINGGSFTTATGSYVATSSDNYIYINNTTAGPITMTLPSSPAQGQKLIYMDVAGNAGTYQITFSGTIDGVSNPPFPLVNYGAATIKWTGSIWKEES